MKISTTAVLGLSLGLLLQVPAPASARSKDPCRKADARLARTGQGDADGDGISDCRELRVLRTLANDRDSDGDRLEDGEEMKRSCNPLDGDSDDDGVDDGEDASPAVEQEVEALLDALTCPQLEVAGSITALGTTAALDAETEFEGASCEELATLLGEGKSVLVEIEILEDVLGALSATEVEAQKPKRGDHDDDDDGHDDDDEDDEDDDAKDDDDDGRGHRSAARR
jgi:hypothetical protein